MLFTFPFLSVVVLRTSAIQTGPIPKRSYKSTATKPEFLYVTLVCMHISRVAVFSWSSYPSASFLSMATSLPQLERVTNFLTATVYLHESFEVPMEYLISGNAFSVSKTIKSIHATMVNHRAFRELQPTRHSISAFTQTPDLWESRRHVTRRLESVRGAQPRLQEFPKDVAGHEETCLHLSCFVNLLRAVVLNISFMKILLNIDLLPLTSTKLHTTVKKIKIMDIAETLARSSTVYVFDEGQTRSNSVSNAWKLIFLARFFVEHHGCQPA